MWSVPCRRGKRRARHHGRVAEDESLPRMPRWKTGHRAMWGLSSHPARWTPAHRLPVGPPHPQRVAEGSGRAHLQLPHAAQGSRARRALLCHLPQAERVHGMSRSGSDSPSGLPPGRLRDLARGGCATELTELFVLSSQPDLLPGLPSASRGGTGSGGGTGGPATEQSLRDRNRREAFPPARVGARRGGGGPDDAHAGQPQLPGEAEPAYLRLLPPRRELHVLSFRRPDSVHGNQPPSAGVRSVPDLPRPFGTKRSGVSQVSHPGRGGALLPVARLGGDPGRGRGAGRCAIGINRVRKGG